MLACLRAPSAPPGVREAGDALWLLPSCALAWSLSSSRRNCELFIARENYAGAVCNRAMKRSASGLACSRAFPAPRQETCPARLEQVMQIRPQPLYLGHGTKDIAPSMGRLRGRLTSRPAIEPFSHYIS